MNISKVIRALDRMLERKEEFINKNCVASGRYAFELEEAQALRVALRSLRAIRHKRVEHFLRLMATSPEILADKQKEIQ